MTTAEIAKAAGLREDQVVHRLRHGVGVAHGIGHNRDDNGVITIVLPEGVPAEALVAGEAGGLRARRRPSRPRRRRNRAKRRKTQQKKTPVMAT
jgi:hypothetical protein